MLVNRTALVLFCVFIVASVLFLFFIPVGPRESGVQVDEQRMLPYTEELRQTWDEKYSKYLNIGSWNTDLLVPGAVALLGVVVVFGADYAVRRKTKSVIERHFTGTKNKG